MLASLPIYILLNLVASVIMIIFGCCFLFVSVPKEKTLTNYICSRRLLAVAYFILAIGNLGAINMQDSESGINIPEVFSVSLITASFQASLFTFTLITLLNPTFAACKKILLKLIPSILFSILIFSILLLDIPSVLIPSLILFFCYYIYQLIHYTYTFLHEEKSYREKLGDFYSGEEADKLHWVKHAFFSALIIGILVATTLTFLNTISITGLILFYSLFYIYFAIRYLNYPHEFYMIREILQPSIQKYDLSLALNDLPEKLEQWIARKGFTLCGLTINDLAGDLKTNRTYLSNYINTYKQVNFNTWINTLRVEEAKRLIEQHPDWSIAKISEEVGFTDSSCFGKQFKKLTGSSPREIRDRYRNIYI